MNLKKQLIEEFNALLKIEGLDRCIGIAANMEFLLICSCETDGKNPELVVYKKYNQITICNITKKKEFIISNYFPLIS